MLSGKKRKTVAIEPTRESKVRRRNDDTETLERIVSEVKDLPHPDKWRREISAIVRVSDKTYRLFMRGVLFQGRCFDCNKNFKSMRHCFLGQTSNKLKGEASVADSTLRAHKYAILKDSFDKSFCSVCDDSLYVFPSETDLERPKKLSRVSPKHNFPPLESLLREEAFCPYFEPSAFEKLFSDPVVVTSNHKNMPGSEEGKREAVWKESDEAHGARKTLYKAAMAKTDDDARRRSVATALAESYTKLAAKTHCSKACERDFKNHRLASLSSLPPCKNCKFVRGALKKHYMDTVDSTVREIVADLFMKRAEPFDKCPTDPFKIGERYVDERCRVERVRESE